MENSEDLRAELEKEKMHRQEAEACLREVRSQNEHCRARLASLEEDFQKMEEMVKDILQFKSRIDQLKHEKSSLSLAYENKIRKYQTCLASLEKENFMLLNELQSLEVSNKDHEQQREQSLCRILIERVGHLEQENRALIMENEQRRLQYEHCLDDVANQVVQTLLAQKGLQEECGKLQCRVQDLEQQNKALTVLFKRQLYHQDLLQKSCPTSTTSPDQEDTVDMILAGRLQNLELGQSNQSPNRRTGRFSPSRTSRSEDSTDSLASICSDYSVKSGNSGRNVVSYPGLPRMSSPPQWLQNHSSKIGYIAKPSISSTSVLAKSLITSTTHDLHNTSMMKDWSDLVPQPSYQDCYNRDEVCNYAFQAEQMELREIHKLKSRDVKHVLEDKAPKLLKSDIANSSFLLDNCRNEIEQVEYSQNSQRLCVNSESLDTIETPSENHLTSENIPYLSYSQKLVVPKEYNIQYVSNTSPGVQVTAAQNAELYCSSSINKYTSCLSHLQYNYPAVMSSKLVSSHNDTYKSEPSIPQPTTINITPQFHCDTPHSFSFPALGYTLNNTCGNVYEEMDLPTFLTEKSNRSRFSESSEYLASPGKNSLLENWYTGGSSSMINYLGEECTNTVIRRGQGDRETIGNTEYCGELENSHNINFSRFKTELQSNSYELSSTPHFPSIKKCLKIDKALKQDSKAMDQPNITNRTPEKQCSTSSSTDIVLTKHGGKDDGYSTMSSDVQTEINANKTSSEMKPDPAVYSESGHQNPGISTVDLDSIMVSSSDSGLGLLQGSQSQRHLSENTEDGCLGFEQDSDSLQIQSEKLVSSDKNSSIRLSPKGDDDEDGVHFDSGLGDSPLIHQFSSFSELDENSPQSNQSQFDPNSNKILRLLTPQGFKVGRNDTRWVAMSDQLSTACQVETAEKATSIDLQYLAVDLLSDSSFSVSSIGSDSRSITSKGQVMKKEKKLVHRETQVELNQSSGSDSSFGTQNRCTSQKETNCISSTEEECIQKAHGKNNNYQNSHCNLYPISNYFQNCFYQKCHQTCLEWLVDPVELSFSNIKRVASDTCLYVKDQAESILQDLKKLAFVDGQERLNFRPLERHMSAQNIFRSPPVTSSRFLPALQCRVLVNQGQGNMQDNDQLISAEKHGQQWNKHEHVPTLSASLTSVQSSDSEHCSCEEYEKLGATSLKCSRDYDLSSGSEDECYLRDHQDFVHQWLQQDCSQLQESIKDVYTDNEEIGKWTFQLSLEDVTQPVNKFCDSWFQIPLFKEPRRETYQGRIQKETIADDHFLKDAWNYALLSSGVSQQTILTSLATSKNSSAPKLTNTPKLKEINEDIINFSCNYKNIKDSLQNISQSTKKFGVLFNGHINRNVDSSMIFPSFSLPNLKFIFSDSSENHQQNKTDKLSESEHCFFTYKEEIQEREPDGDVNKEERYNNQNLHTNTTEFIKDFYRLYPLRSIKSLRDCPKSLPTSEQPSSSEQLLQKQPTKDLNDSISKLPLQKQSSKNIDDFCSNLLLQEQSTKGLGDTLSNLSQQKQFSKDLDDSVSNLLQQKQLSNLSVQKQSIEDLDTIAKTVPLQNVEYASHSNKDTSIGIEKDKGYSDCSCTKITPLETENIKRTKTSSLKVKELKDCLLTKGNNSENVSKKQHKIPTQNPTSEAVPKDTDAQSLISAKEKLLRHDKTKIPVKFKSPAYEKSHKDISSVIRNNSFAKQDVHKRQNIKAKDISIKKSQSSQQILKNIRRSHHQLSDNARKDGNVESGRPLKKSYHNEREMEKERKDQRVFLKEKTISETNTNRKDMHGRLRHSKQSVGKEFQPKKEQEKRQLDNFKELPLPKNSVTLNLEEVLNLTVADKIQHFSTLLAQTEKERLSLILQSEIQCPKTFQEHFSTESSFGREINACNQQKEESQNSGNKEGCETSWIHVEADVDLSDPKARANLLDSMIASSSSNSSDEENNGDEVQEHQHNQRLHALHRFRRQKKRGLFVSSDRDAVVSFIPKNRTSVINGYDIFYRFGEKEREAVACFDFLDEFSTSPSDVGSSEILSEERRSITPVIGNSIMMPQESVETSNILHDFDISMSNLAPLDNLNIESGNKRLTDSCVSSMTFLSQDGESVDHISFSDSCAESYSSSTQSLNYVS
ncbi:uncharacterized protein LOC106459576 isoform X1 [Limulus polyphemus]|uniref:Uncharacterized protein LOC106459576 isoform X1 n=1 Tax=Limulus polyphemus TaxID=6850 RepID=A0ABM1SDT8_LIMPO|nr:uncharacterized protein LOC106459576 isoform X1 [Limulus polyphemus]